MNYKISKTNLEVILNATRKIIMIMALIGLSGFAIATNELGSSANPIFIAEFKPVSEVHSINASSIQYIDHGLMNASWYGPRFHGRLTANGEIYDQNALTVAHKSFSFGTLLRITNIKTNKSIIVRVNDRGPYIPGRQMDLSKAAAEELGVIYSGVKELKVGEIVLDWSNNPIL